MRASDGLWAAVVTGALCVAGCGDESRPPPEYPPMHEPERSEPEPEPPQQPAGADAPEPEEPPPPPVQVVAADRSPLEGKPPRIRIALPRDDQLTRRSPVRARIQLRGWELEDDPGRHVHLIVDNQPYIAIRDVSKPLDLHALAEEHLGEPLGAGTHVLRVFPSRAHHESVKEGTPFAVATFHYQKRSDDRDFDPDAPLLTYSRPKGCNELGSRVLLDFYLTNVEELSEDGHRVQYTIGEVTGEITEWKPHYIENLQPGEHQVQLRLLDPEGEPVEGPFNDTTRTIRVADGCDDGGSDTEAQEPSDGNGDGDGDGDDAEASEDGSGG